MVKKVSADANCGNGLAPSLSDDELAFYELVGRASPL